MCAIHPKREATFILRVYSAFNMSDKEWHDLILRRVCEGEVFLNEDMRLRWHLQELIDRKALPQKDCGTVSLPTVIGDTKT